MAITNGATLATAVGNWLARADLSSRIPEFVALAEAKFNRELRTPDMETKDASFSITGEYVAVPTGFLEVRYWHLNDGDKNTLAFLPPDTQSGYLPDGTGIPVYYSVTGSNFRFAPVPDGTYASTLIYYKALTTCSTGSTETNWLLTSHPDVYLYGALLEAAGYLHDDARVQTWYNAYRAATEQLKRQGARQRWSGPSMAARVA